MFRNPHDKQISKLALGVQFDQEFVVNVLLQTEQCRLYLYIYIKNWWKRNILVVPVCLFMEGLFLKFNNFSEDKIIEEVLVCVLFLVLKWCNECWREAVVQKMIYRWQAWAARFIMIVLAKYCLHWPVSQCLENHTIPIWLLENFQYLVYPKMKG